MPNVTFRRIGLAGLVVAALLATTTLASASPPYVFRYVAFVTLTGHGTVHSHPRGITCPKSCRFAFPRGTHIDLTAEAAPGWRFAGFSSKWCKGTRVKCGVDLVSTHDCVGGACPLGAFGIRALFVRTE